MLTLVSHNGSIDNDNNNNSVNDLEDVVLFCNSDSVIDDFKDASSNVSLGLLQSRLLMPFF